MDEAPPRADDAFPFVLAAGERRDYNANQIEFINLIINQLVDHGIVRLDDVVVTDFNNLSNFGIEDPRMTTVGGIAFRHL